MSNRAAADAILKALGKSGGPVVKRPAPVAAAPVSTPDEQPAALCEPELQEQQLQPDDVVDDVVDDAHGDHDDHRHGGVDQIEDSPTFAAARAEVLDTYRHDVDRAANRGYDYDLTAPSHAEIVARQNPAELNQPELNQPELPTAPELNPGEFLKPGELPTAAMVDAWRNDPRIPVQVAEELRRWEQQLVLMGWSHERIWRPSFWPHSDEHPRGLAAVLNADDRIIAADPDGEGYLWIEDRYGRRKKLPRRV